MNATLLAQLDRTIARAHETTREARHVRATAIQPLHKLQEHPHQRYFFHLIDRDERVDDHVGKQFVSQSEVRLEAGRRAAKMIAERLLHLSPRELIDESSVHLEPLDHMWIEITDAAGTVVETVNFRDVLNKE